MLQFSLAAGDTDAEGQDQRQRATGRRLSVGEVFLWLGIFLGFGFLHLACFEDLFAVQALDKFAIVVMGDYLEAIMVTRGFHRSVLFIAGEDGPRFPTGGSAKKISRRARSVKEKTESGVPCSHYS